MTRWIEYSAWLWGALACAAAVFAVITLRPDRRGARCPGTQAWWIGWILPWRWFRSAGCGYDLRGLVSGPDGHVRCPECGSLVCGHGHWTSRLAGAGPWMRVALLAVIAGMCCWNVRWIRRGGWTRYTPTALLSATSGGLTDWTPRGVKGELERRLDDGELSKLQRRWLAEAAIRNLGDDSACWNADWARGVLWRVGDEALPLIEAALDSSDYQRRQLAADMLRERWLIGTEGFVSERKRPPYSPPDRLFEVTVEGLADDQFQWTSVTNAYDGLVFLVNNPERSGRFLDVGLASDDAQQAFFSALVAGLLGDARLIDRAAPILIEHLASNGGSNDACAATRALYCFGSAVLPYVKPWTASDDRQLAQLTRLIEVDLEIPWAPIERRRSLNGITRLVKDPATDLTLGMIRDLRP